MDPFIFLDTGMPDSGMAGRGDEPKTAWDWLSRGKTLGKSAVLSVRNGVAFNEARGRVDVLELRGGDRYALPLSVTTAPPTVLPENATVVPGQEQNTSGFIPLAERLAAGGSNLELPNILMRLQWGIGGVSYDVDLDVLHGSVVNIQASWVRAFMYYEDTGFPTTAWYQVSAFVGPGKPSSRAQRTQSLGILATGVASTIYATPRFAKDVLVTGSNNADVFVGTIRFYRDIQCLAPVGEYLFAANSSNNLPVPIPNGGYFYRVTPAIDLAFTNAVFGLAV